VLLLARHFLNLFNQSLNKRIAGISPAARDNLRSHPWPGNVRELRNVMERALILETTSEVQARSLPDFQLESRLRKGESPHVTGGRSLDELVAGFERDLIVNTLEQNHHNLSRTADDLKISRHALRYRMQRLNLQSAQDAESPTHAAPDKRENS
jgi:transcriptional regulator with PAS, ATPase and Fis domain